jgi:hypothetical protein
MKYIASFIGQESGKALFVGLYSIGQSRPMTYDQYWRVPAYIELKKFNMEGFTGKKRSSLLWFDLVLTEFCASWKGKLIIEWLGESDLGGGEQTAICSQFTLFLKRVH